MNDPVVVSNPKRMLLALTALALTVLVFTLASVVKRVLFPYDLLAWSDDYVFNELLKLRLGAPLYGAYDAGNSFTYPPGGVLLHHALLAPLGLDLSLVAIRVLAQVWLVLAVVLGVRLVSRISLGRFARPAESVPALVGCAAALLLAGYSNSLADSLHPATLELLVLTVAATLAAEWSRLPRLGRFGAVLLLPACALLVKQSGVSVALALACGRPDTGARCARRTGGVRAVELASPPRRRSQPCCSPPMARSGTGAWRFHGGGRACRTTSRTSWPRPARSGRCWC